MCGTVGISFTAQSTLLFIGDSITDCDRRNCPEEIGKGYVRLVRDALAAGDPKCAPRVFNRGISGNKVTDLRKRWQRDVLDLAPDVLSVFIGINDVWHGWVPGRVGCPIDEFVATYRELLAETRQRLPGISLVLCEPSVIWLADPPDAGQRLEPYVLAVHELGREFVAESVVPLNGAFSRAKATRPDIPWTTDGVHPSSYGHMLIAREWLVSTGLASGGLV